MAGRSVRIKIKYQADKILTKVDGIFSHLRYIDEISQEKSQYINDHLPNIVELTEVYKKMIELFREGL